MPSGPLDKPAGNEKTARRTSSSETVKQYLSEGQAGQRSHLMQAGAFVVVSAACPAMDSQDCRLAALRFPSSSLADKACAKRAGL